MAAIDYQICTSLLKAYIANKSEKNPEDRREITDTEIISLIKLKLAWFCIDHKTDTMFVDENGTIIELKAQGELLEQIRDILKEEDKTLQKYSDSHWVSVNNEIPSVDEEVMVMTKDGQIDFAHIVDKDIAVDYDGWNIPGVEFWMPCNFSKEMKEFYDED